jgi:hypothetical protein
MTFHWRRRACRGRGVAGGVGAVAFRATAREWSSLGRGRRRHEHYGNDALLSDPL